MVLAGKPHSSSFQNSELTLVLFESGITQYLIYDRSVCGKSASTCEAERFIPLSVWVQTPTYSEFELDFPFDSISRLQFSQEARN